MFLLIKAPGIQGFSNIRGERCNDFSIGTGLEGTDTQLHTDRQYRKLAALTRLLIQHYPCISNNIAGHYDISPVRKTDPQTDDKPPADKIRQGFVRKINCKITRLILCW